jgi:hypothetical protein
MIVLFYLVVTELETTRSGGNLIAVLSRWTFVLASQVVGGSHQLSDMISFFSCIKFHLTPLSQLC